MTRPRIYDRNQFNPTRRYSAVCSCGARNRVSGVHGAANAGTLGRVKGKPEKWLPLPNDDEWTCVGCGTNYPII
ncbi:hypothetical protein ISU10_11270 [Nocardioides agariphilus]|uniref:Uncharacterized protein n=1 Tax=Nocardioides agariphilus TaxID=433664 RepID=A0A930VKJ6_9ACTN|nr:hypothetical protein [Nocardioides agariphilus]MBF4768347.1 hypothetical protein [Nocardioides agariphilus]